jgi:hypothetical protein
MPELVIDMNNFFTTYSVLINKLLYGGKQINQHNLPIIYDYLKGIVNFLSNYSLDCKNNKIIKNIEEIQTLFDKISIQKQSEKNVLSQFSTIIYKCAVTGIFLNYAIKAADKNNSKL